MKEMLTYKDEINQILNPFISFEHADVDVLKDKRVLITGATGLIGTYIVECFRELINTYKINVKVTCICHSKLLKDEPNIHYVKVDITQPIVLGAFDYIIHAASNTHPKQYAGDPIGTITTNVFGTKNLLDLAALNPKSRFILCSSVEVYGKSIEGQDEFTETSSGYIDCNTLRANYPESKRLSETLCNAYREVNGQDFVIARLTRCYGSTIKKDDTKVLSQFINNALEGKDIVLKSKGEQEFSYVYVADAVSAIFTLLFYGESGNAYNISDNNSNIKLKDLAKYIASKSHTNVVFDLPDDVESKGFSTADMTKLNTDKIEALGWKAKTDIKEGILRVLTRMQLES